MNYNYNYGSTAYDYDYDYHEEYNSEQEQIKQRRREERARREENKNTRRKLGYIFVAGLAFSFLIAKTVAVSDTEKRIRDLTEELSVQQTYTSEKTFELEQKVSLTAIEDAAMARLGMQRPDKTQVVYLDIEKDDYTERTVQEVEGIGNKVGTSLKNAKQTIINIFTLK